MGFCGHINHLVIVLRGWGYFSFSFSDLGRLIFYPIDWVIMVVTELTETTYYKDKVYLPREVKEKLGLIDGDVLNIEVVEKGVAKISVARQCRTAKKALEKLDNPPDLGKIKGKLTREEIYEDIT